MEIVILSQCGYQIQAILKHEMNRQEYPAEPFDKKPALQAKIELAEMSNLLY